MGSTAVLIATRSEDKHMVELLDNGADFTIKTESGVTPYDYAEKGSGIKKIFDSVNRTKRAKTETTGTECSEMEEDRDPNPFSQTELTSLPIESTDDEPKQETSHSPDKSRLVI